MGPPSAWMSIAVSGGNNQQPRVEARREVVDGLNGLNGLNGRIGAWHAVAVRVALPPGASLGSAEHELARPESSAGVGVGYFHPRGVREPWKTVNLAQTKRVK